MRESPHSLSDGMFVDKEWNAAYIHVVYSCCMPDSVEDRGTLTRDTHIIREFLWE